MGKVINFGATPKVIAKKQAEAAEVLDQAIAISSSPYLSAGEKTEMVADVLESARNRETLRRLRRQGEK